MMTAEAFVKTSKALPNFLICVCTLLSLHVTWYSSESKLPLTFNPYPANVENRVSS